MLVNAGATAKIHPTGKWVWQFPAQWFVAGNGYTGSSATCYAGWSVRSVTGTKTVTADTCPLETLTAAGKLPYNAGANTNNSFGVLTDDTAATSTIDTTNTLLPPVSSSLTGAATILKLVSTYNDGSGTSRWRIADYTSTVLFDLTDKLESHRMAVFTSCVKWVSSLPVITSLYTYIDIQIKWHWISSDSSNPHGAQATSMGIPMSNLRLIKLFPEAGVMHDTSKNYSSTANGVSPVISHTIYVNGGQDSDIDSVCLLEFNGVFIQAQKDSSSNALVLWLFFGTLLETDRKSVV